jgi:hypothetical protein
VSKLGLNPKILRLNNNYERKDNNKYLTGKAKKKYYIQVEGIRMTMTKEKPKKKASGLAADLEKTFGVDILRSGSSIKEKEVLTIPLSPSLDMILNGGVPEGSFVVLTGQPKCGKTVTSLSLAATALDPKYQGNLEKPRHAYYLNIEGRLKKARHRRHKRIRLK